MVLALVRFRGRNERQFNGLFFSLPNEEGSTERKAQSDQ